MKPSPCICAYIKCMCIAHYIHVAKVYIVSEEEKKGRKPRPNKLHLQSTNKQKRTLGCPTLGSEIVG